MSQIPPPPPPPGEGPPHEPYPAMPPMEAHAVMLPELPGATAGLVLGICSIVFSMPIIGLILGFIGLQKSRDAKRWAEMHPGMYSNLGVAQAGFVCSIIGLVLGAFSTLCGCGYMLIIAVAIAGGAAGAGQGGGF